MCTMTLYKRNLNKRKTKKKINEKKIQVNCIAYTDTQKLSATHTYTYTRTGLEWTDLWDGLRPTTWN